MASGLPAAALLLGPGSASAQGGPQRVEYDVELSVQGSPLDVNCAVTGSDVLTGTIVGMEPAPPDDPAVYVGRLMRSTRLSTCGTRRTPAGIDVVCSINISGGGFPAVIMTIEPGGQGTWIQYLDNPAPWARIRMPPPPAGQAYSSVTGTCDPAEMAHLQRSYDNGDTAGSPSGQPLEVPRLPPSAIPDVFAANPPVSVWTLKVLARRP
jgi:hypothetical protein